MDKSNSYRIEVRAAQALAEWKALFAEQVAIHVKACSRAGTRLRVSRHTSARTQADASCRGDR